MVLGTLVALGAPINAAAVAVSVISLLLVSTLLLMNQIPDAEADRRGGRHHAVIVLGVYKAARLAGIMLLASYGVLALALVSGWLPTATALGLITLPLALWIAVKLPQVADDHQRLPPVLAVNVACLLATLALLVIGLSM
jgi:1,4-dihydroxy-2-naphthoate octaprenyltransferase